MRKKSHTSLCIRPGNVTITDQPTDQEYYATIHTYIGMNIKIELATTETLSFNIIQLIHSFEVNIRLCLSENSTFDGRQILLLTEKRVHQLLAPLSRRLTGELIVYQSLRRPSSVVRHHFQTSSPLKPLGQLNKNFIWRLLRTRE